MQETVFTRRGVERVMRYAFALAARRPDGHVTSATKSNGIIHTMPFWDEVFAGVAAEHPGTASDQVPDRRVLRARRARPRRAST